MHDTYSSKKFAFEMHAIWWEHTIAIFLWIQLAKEEAMTLLIKISSMQERGQGCDEQAQDDGE